MMSCSLTLPLTPLRHTCKIKSAPPRTLDGGPSYTVQHIGKASLHGADSYSLHPKQRTSEDYEERVCLEGESEMCHPDPHDRTFSPYSMLP